MGREVRRVPPGWEHPRDRNGKYIPMHDSNYDEKAKEWMAEYALFVEGKHPSQIQFAESNPGKPYYCKYYWQCSMPPDEESYRTGDNQFSPEDATMYMMYEDTTEGTPISPAFVSPEQLARWLADTGANSFGGMTATYEQWLRVCVGGYAPSMVYTPTTGLVSGVEMPV